MKNRHVKQMICDVLTQRDDIESAWFSNECPLHVIGKRNGKYEYLNLHIVQVSTGPFKFKTQNIQQYKKPVSLTADQLRAIRRP